MGHRLRPIQHHHGAHTMGPFHNFLHGTDAAQNVGHMGHCHQLCLPVDPLVQGLFREAAIRFAVQITQGRAGLLANHLPGQQIAVVLQNAHRHLVPSLQRGKSVGVRHQIQALAGVPGEDHLTGVFRPNKPRHPCPGILIGLGGRKAQGIEPPQGICVGIAVKIAYRIQHALGPLGRGGIVEIRLTVVPQQWKILPNFLYVQHGYSTS